jgi:hypothetical protein
VCSSSQPLDLGWRHLIARMEAMDSVLRQRPEVVQLFCALGRKLEQEGVSLPACPCQFHFYIIAEG